ncbi:hypothetical protein [Olivibacter domesticus]|uniref:Uncharacterized protein n=1 Tax=Olivibacter domesticus TaxID=407022 RepID=A0A1H7XFL8_OLID1|nr:hypothetical protein [Olivibacter domesticus]SEM31977.1 hypothetical protein SAMN05661044_04855 [Olivibacter domesticus]
MQESKSKRVSVWLWHEDYPHSLNEEELRTPALVLRDVFSQFSLADCQYLLWEWQHCHYRPFLFAFGNGLLTLFRFRKMLNKLLDVAWLITRDVDDGHLFRLCDEKNANHLLGDNYFIALKKEDLWDLNRTLSKMLSKGGGLQWWKNILYHWWGMGVDKSQLDDGGRTNPTDEIPQFMQLILMIEIQYVLAMSLDVTAGESKFAATAYLSREEGQYPFKTLMKMFSKWEYDSLKDNLRDVYYLVDYGMDEGNLSKHNGLIHTQHKMVALAAILAQKEDEYFAKPEIFRFKDEEIGSFWEHDHYVPFHHLSKSEYENPLATLRQFNFAELNRKLHQYTVFLVERHRFELDDEVLSFADLFQQLERLLETLYLFIVQRIRIGY